MRARVADSSRPVEIQFIGHTSPNLVGSAIEIDKRNSSCALTTQSRFVTDAFIIKRNR